MPLINYVVNSFEQLHESMPVDLVITDGDDTLFPYGSPEPYVDSLGYLNMLEPKQLVLVSGNPDELLAQARANSINADSYFVPSRRPQLVKYQLFAQAIAHAVREIDAVDSVVILGNRWCMDIVVAKLALQRYAVPNVEGILVQRHTAHEEIIDRFINPVQYVGATALKKVGLDTVIRPRRTP